MMKLLPLKQLRRIVPLLISLSFLIFLFKVYIQENPTKLGIPPLNTRELLQQEVHDLSIKHMTTASSTVVTETAQVQDQAEVQVLVDDTPPRSESELFSDLQGQYANIPLPFFRKAKTKKYGLNKTCATYPTLYDLHINNEYWQETTTSNGTFYLYGAYLDVRRTNGLGPTVRVLGMIDRLEPTVKTFCQIWFDESPQPVISKVLEYKYIWYKKWGNYKPGIFQPYLMACQIPKSFWRKTPATVSIVEDPCEKATNNLKVIYNKLEEDEAKKSFAVCVKGLDFPDQDISVRLVEWLETLEALGADKVFLYNLEIHPNVSRILDFYVERGLVDLTPITLPGYLPNMHFLQHLYLKSKTNTKRQNELIPYNDCLYRNLYRYEYIALLDIDEVIVPKKGDNWSDLMKEVVQRSLKVKNDSRASYNFRNVYFMDEMLDAHLQSPSGPETQAMLKDIPSYMHIMRHVYRSANYTKPGQYVKCFHNPLKALTLHNHFPLACLGGSCSSYPVDPSIGHLQHYRKDCVSPLKKSCDNYKNVSILDTSVWKHKEKILKRSSDVLTRLGFLR